MLNFAFTEFHEVHDTVKGRIKPPPNAIGVWEPGGPV
jgi:hypothetical protein